MTALETQRMVYNLVTGFFTGASVQFGRQRGVKPKLPAVIITVGPEQRSTHPMWEFVDGVPVARYTTNQKFTIDLFTSGSPLTDVPEGFTAPNENTAVSDLQDFLNYLDSPVGRGILHKADMSILTDSQVQDVSAFVDDVDVDYRARVELSIDYIQSTAGAYGFRNSAVGTKTNGSGGGSYEMASAETGYFEVVDIDSSNLE